MFSALEVLNDEKVDRLVNRLVHPFIYEYIFILFDDN
jgi:hypothetical protein